MVIEIQVWECKGYFLNSEWFSNYYIHIILFFHTIRGKKTNIKGKEIKKYIERLRIQTILIHYY